MTYEVVYQLSAAKDLRAIRRADSKLAKRIITKIEELAQNPRPVGAIPLAGREGWRIRIGGYRVIYEIDDETVVIVVVRIGKRGEVYR